MTKTTITEELARLEAAGRAQNEAGLAHAAAAMPVEVVNLLRHLRGALAAAVPVRRPSSQGMLLKHWDAEALDSVVATIEDLLAKATWAS